MANSNPMKPEKKKVNKCEVAAVVSILLCLIAVEVIMPIGICPGAVLDNVVKLRTAEGISKRTETETVSTKYFHVYNLTNAYALQTQTPAPTPVFVEVKVPYTYRFREYDPTFSGDEYTMSVWMHHSPVLASDLDQIIIVPNVALITFLTAIGGEAVLPFIPGGAAIQGMLTADAMGLKPDGSGAFNAGLFTRRTVREVLEGYVDPLLGPIPSPVDPTAATYNTHATLEDQQEAVANGVESPLKYQTTYKTGQSGADQIDRIVSFRGKTNFTPDAPDIAEWIMFNPKWDNTGNTSTERGSLVWAGLRSFTQPVVPLATCPSVMSAGMNLDLDIMPSSTESISYDYIYFQREVKYECLNGCPRSKLNGNLNVRKFDIDVNKLGVLKKNGVADPTCADTVPNTCDFGSQYTNVWEFGGPRQVGGHPLSVVMSYSPPYNGGVSEAVAAAVAIYDSPDLSNQPVFDQSIHFNSLLVEPMSGAMVSSTNDVLQNVWVKKTILNGATWANVFSGSNDNNDAIMMPMGRMTITVGASKEATREMANGLGTLYFVMTLIYVAIFCNLLYLAIKLINRHILPGYIAWHTGAYRQKRQSSPAKPTKAQKIQVKPHTPPDAPSDSNDCAA